MLDSKNIVNCMETMLKKGIPATKEQIESSIIFQMGCAVSQSKGRIEYITKWLSELDDLLSAMLEDRDTDALWHTRCMDGICQTQLMIGCLWDSLSEIAICQRIYQGTQNPDKSSDDDGENE